MYVGPALGRQRRRDPLRLTGQSSQLNWRPTGLMRGPYVKREGGERLRKTPEVLLYTCAHTCTCVHIHHKGRGEGERGEGGRLANLECKGRNENILEWNKTMALFHHCPGSLTRRWTFFCRSEFSHKDYYLTPPSQVSFCTNTMWTIRLIWVEFGVSALFRNNPCLI